MMYLSLDTNAILDICYRTYPELTFPKLWELLDDLILTTTIKFCVCSSVLEETRAKCATFEFEENVLEDFLSRFRVAVIDRDDVGNKILSIRAKLLAYPFSATSPHALKDEPDVDLIATAQKYNSNGYVITGEIGFIGNKWDTLNAKRNQRIKIPDICALMNVVSYSWLNLFQKYNLTLD